MATVAVLGGGISGLSCAYYLKTLGQSRIKYLCLIEKMPKFGGWIQTTRFPDGAVFDHGPRTLRVGTKAGYNALHLADQLDLTSRILPVTKHHPTAKTNLILSQGQLHPLPRSLLAIFKRSPPFSKRVIHYVCKELMTEKTVMEDESVYSFAERRIGRDVADYAFDPLCRGISAGDARELSVKSMFPSMFDAEQQHGSIVKGLIKNTKAPPASEFMSSNLVKRSFKEIWRMWTLKTGLSELIDALACSVEEIGVSDLLFNSECTQLSFQNNAAELVVENEKIVVDHVFSCIPSQSLSKLIGQYPSISSTLNSIPSVDVAVVYLEYKENVLKKQGFGFLAPSFEDSKVLGIVFDSCCFPQLNGSSQTRLTCMIGGKWFKNILGNPENVNEDEVLKIALQEARRHLGIEDLPIRHKVVLQRQCIPQYVVGHSKKLEVIETEINKTNLCVSLLGASYKGAGVPDCIYNSKVAVEEYLKSL